MIDILRILYNKKHKVEIIIQKDYFKIDKHKIYICYE